MSTSKLSVCTVEKMLIVNVSTLSLYFSILLKKWRRTIYDRCNENGVHKGGGPFGAIVVDKLKAIKYYHSRQDVKNIGFDDAFIYKKSRQTYGADPNFIRQKYACYGFISRMGSKARQGYVLVYVKRVQS